jgi:hypothetical protein
VCRVLARAGRQPPSLSAPSRLKRFDDPAAPGGLCHGIRPPARPRCAISWAGASGRRGARGHRRPPRVRHAHPARLAASARRTVTGRSRAGDRTELQETYKTLLEQTPPTAEALYDAGAIAGRLGRARDQEAAWRRLRKEFPEHPLATRAALDLASAAFKRKDWKEAAALAQAAAESEDEGLRAEALLLAGEADQKQSRSPPPRSRSGRRRREERRGGRPLPRSQGSACARATARLEGGVARPRRSPGPDATLRDCAARRGGGKAQ